MDNNYNIEDTARLMTISSRGNRTRKIVLIAVSAVLVAAIAVAGFILIGNRRYDHQLEIADRAFAEGNYELAEAEYLKAVEMNKRKPKAREGLAYTYAVQGKKQESIETYTGLKKDFGDQKKYDDAIKLVEQDQLPDDTDLIPAVGLWRNFSAEEIPYSSDLNEYLWGLHYDYFDVDGSKTFDCNEPAGFPALSMLMGYPGLYSCSIEERMESEAGEEAAAAMGWTEEWGEKLDPREWVRKYEEDGEIWGGYSSIDTAKADEMVKAVFNVGDDTIKEDLSRGAKEKDLYEEDGRYYYVMYGGGGAADYAFESGDAWTDGQKYCLKYEAGWWDVDSLDEKVDMADEHCTCYIIFEPKLIEGKHYWSLYYLGTEMPQDVTEGLAYTYGGGGKTDSSGKNSGSGYQPVIDEYKQVLEEAANGKEYDVFGSGNPNGFKYVFAEMIPHELNGYRTPQYAMKDINGDGVTEMVVGVWDDEEYQGYVGSILTLDKSGKPVVVINCESFMYRAVIAIFEDSTIMTYGSSGADNSRADFYTLEGTGLKTTDSFRADNGKCTHNGEPISDDEYADRFEERSLKPEMEFDWKSF